MSHELVEMLSDPEGDGWYAPPAATGEIGDAAVSGSVKQTAWVNGAHVQAYWSNRHSATVIPMDRDYRARFRGTLAVDSRHSIGRGTFRPDPSERRLCAIAQACCLEDRDYTWEVTGRDESVTLRLETQRYRQPKATWTIAGNEASAAGLLTVRVQTETYNGRTAVYDRRDVQIAYLATDTSLELSSTGQDANFDVEVGCVVTEGAISGNVKSNVVSRPRATVGFVGAELVVDARYTEQKAAWLPATKRYTTCSTRPPAESGNRQNRVSRSSSNRAS